MNIFVELFVKHVKLLGQYKKKLKRHKAVNAVLNSPKIVKANKPCVERQFNDLLEEWLKYHSNEVCESTAYKFETQCRYVRKYFTGMWLYEIDTIKINDFIVEMKRNGYSDSAVSNYCKLLSLCLGYGYKMHYIPENPVINACIPKVPRHKEIYPFTIQEVFELLKVNYLQWVKDGIVIAFHTGMREGEIYALRWSDINFDQQFIMVQRSQSRACSKITIKATKTASGIRRIDIDKYLTEYLRNMKKYSISKYVFDPPNDCKYDFRVPWNLAQHVRKMCMLSGIPPRNFHALRHTHATVLLAYDVHPKIVKERLGHSDIGITIETYSHTLPTIQREAVRVFEQICSGYYNGTEKEAALVFEKIFDMLPCYNEQIAIA